MTIATTMPSMLTENTQSASTGQASVWPVNNVNAGIGATRPAEMIDAADEAVVWFITFSCMPQGRAPRRSPASRQNAKAISADVIDMLNDQPIFKPL